MYNGCCFSFLIHCSTMYVSRCTHTVMAPLWKKRIRHRVWSSPSTAMPTNCQLRMKMVHSCPYRLMFRQLSTIHWFLRRYTTGSHQVLPLPLLATHPLATLREQVLPWLPWLSSPFSSYLPSAWLLLQASVSACKPYRSACAGIGLLIS